MPRQPESDIIDHEHEYELVRDTGGTLIYHCFKCPWQKTWKYIAKEK
jgi:hypothetical protein